MYGLSSETALDFGPKTKPKHKMALDLFKTIPSIDEVLQLEKRLNEMKQAREQARSEAIKQYKEVIDQIPEVLPLEDAMSLLHVFERRLKFGHKKVRGSPVSPELKANLISALKMESHTLKQLEKLFGLSISYISNVKKEIGLTKPRSHPSHHLQSA